MPRGIISSFSFYNLKVFWLLNHLPAFKTNRFKHKELASCFLQMQRSQTGVKWELKGCRRQARPSLHPEASILCPTTGQRT